MGQLITYHIHRLSARLASVDFGDLPYLLRLAASACMSRGKVQLAISLDTLLVAEIHIVCLMSTPNYFDTFRKFRCVSFRERSDSDGPGSALGATGV